MVYKEDSAGELMAKLIEMEEQQKHTAEMLDGIKKALTRHGIVVKE